MSDVTTNGALAYWTNWPVVKTGIELDGLGACEPFGVYDTNQDNLIFLLEWVTNNYAQ